MNERWFGDDVVPGALVDIRERIESLRTPLLEAFGARVALLNPEVGRRVPEAEVPELFGALVTWYVAADDVIDRLRALRAPEWSACADLLALQRLADALDWTFRDVLADAYTTAHSRAFGNSTRLMLALAQRLLDVESQYESTRGGEGRAGRAWNYRAPRDGAPNATPDRAYVRPTLQRLDLPEPRKESDVRSPINEALDL